MPFCMERQLLKYEYLHDDDLFYNQENQISRQVTTAHDYEHVQTVSIDFLNRAQVFDKHNYNSKSGKRQKTNPWTKHKQLGVF